MKVLLLEGHPLVRLALQMLITQLSPQAAVLALGSVGEARRRLAREGQADLVLLDQSITDEIGDDPLPALRADFPTMPVAMLAETEQSLDVLRAVDAGAMGFVSKRAPLDELLHALNMLLQGGVFLPGSSMPEDGTAGDIPPLPPPLPSEQVRALLAGAQARDLAWQNAQSGEPAPLPGQQPVLKRYAALGLTMRQGEVLDLMLRGLPNKVIARELGVSAETVKDHVAVVLRTLGVSTRTQVVLAMARLDQARLRR